MSTSDDKEKQVRKARIITVALTAFGAITILSGCGTVSSPEPDQMALHYEAGPYSAVKFVKCIPGGTRVRDGVSDKHFTYPVGRLSSQYDITVKSDDNTELKTSVVVISRLTSDCKLLRQFHETTANRMMAYWDGFDAEIDVKTTVPPGWRNLEKIFIGGPTDKALDRISQTKKWRDLYNDPATKVAVEEEFLKALPGLITAQIGGAYFTIESVQIGAFTPTNQNLLNNIKAEQAAVASADAALAAAKAQEASAKAQKAVAQAEAAKIMALRKLLGEKGWLAYQRELTKRDAISRGLNPYQPNGVLIKGGN